MLQIQSHKSGCVCKPCFVKFGHISVALSRLPYHSSVNIAISFIADLLHNIILWFLFHMYTYGFGTIFQHISPSLGINFVNFYSWYIEIFIHS